MDCKNATERKEPESEPKPAANVVPLTIGRKVYFVPDSEDTDIAKGLEPYVDATIIDVISDYRANLVINDVAGNRHVRHSVLFCHNTVTMDEATRDGIDHAHWMPYQINQAKASEVPSEREERDGDAVAAV